MSLEIGSAFGGRSSRGDAQRSLNTYPHAFFDPSSAFIPSSMKELFRWCQYLYLTHSEIAPVVNKKCAYVITQFIYDSKNQYAVDAWKSLFEGTLRLQEEEYKLLVDLEVYGNAFSSIYRPFERYLKCNRCKKEHAARRVKWVYRDHKFTGHCPDCKVATEFTPRDQAVKNRQRIRLIRWNPKYIHINHNPISDRSIYIYDIPKWLRKKITDHKQNKDLIEDLPMSFLNAVKGNKNIRIDPDNIFHFKTPSISMEDASFGVPPILAVFKDAWLFQTYRRAQECVALEHILPLTVLSPAPSLSGDAPHQNIDLTQWSMKMQSVIQKWRRDPNGIFVMPFPTQTSQIRGDAQALNVHQDMVQVRQQITGGLDVPQEFLYGGLSWSGSSISLRILENIFIGRVKQLNRFLEEFVIPRIQRWCDLPPINIRHRDFKMADDAQQKQIALSLRQTNTLSDQTTTEELGFDYNLERTRKAEEEVERIGSMEQMQINTARIQGQGMMIQAEYQARAEVAAAKAREDAQNQAALEGYQPMSSPEEEAAAQGGEGGKGGKGGKGKKEEKDPGAPGGTATAPTDETLLDMMAHNVLKSTPPGSVESELSVYEKKNPALAKAIAKRRKLIDSQVKSVKPLPEQKPPRRANSPV